MKFKTFSELRRHHKHDSFPVQNVFLGIGDIESDSWQGVHDHLFAKVQQVEDGLKKGSVERVCELLLFIYQDLGQKEANKVTDLSFIKVCGTMNVLYKVTEWKTEESSHIKLFWRSNRKRQCVFKFQTSAADSLFPTVPVFRSCIRYPPTPIQSRSGHQNADVSSGTNQLFFGKILPNSRIKHVSKRIKNTFWLLLIFTELLTLHLPSAPKRHLFCDVEIAEDKCKEEGNSRVQESSVIRDVSG